MYMSHHRSPLFSLPKLSFPASTKSSLHSPTWTIQTPLLPRSNCLWLVMLLLYPKPCPRFVPGLYSFFWLKCIFQPPSRILPDQVHLYSFFFLRGCSGMVQVGEVPSVSSWHLFCCWDSLLFPWVFYICRIQFSTVFYIPKKSGQSAPVPCLTLLSGSPVPEHMGIVSSCSHLPLHLSLAIPAPSCWYFPHANLWLFLVPSCSLYIMLSPWDSCS